MFCKDAFHNQMTELLIVKNQKEIPNITVHENYLDMADATSHAFIGFRQQLPFKSEMEVVQY